MTTPLTAAELERFRRKIGDQTRYLDGVAQETVFSDDELQDIWTEQGGNWNKSILAAFEELLGNAYRFSEYTRNETTEKRNQIFQNLKYMAAYWQGKVDKSANSQQVRIVGLKPVPRPMVDEPYAQPDDANRLND